MKYKYWITAILVLLSTLLIAASCDDGSQERKDAAAVDRQQSQYAKGQPIPVFNWSLERHLVAELYRVRNQRVSTHAVWRSNYGMVEGDCPSMGYGIPYDTSLTNPLKKVYSAHGSVVVEQAEPNGIFASKNTAATWVMCVGKSGVIEPVYIESKVTIYPGPVHVDYKTNRVTRAGKANVKIVRK
jgi:hypothetical protein